MKCIRVTMTSVFSDMKIISFLIMLSFSGSYAFCQGKPGKQPRRLSIRERYKTKGYLNTLTANVPTGILIDILPGISAGMEYERFINHRGTLSFSVPAYAFTARTPYKELHREVKGYYTVPALLYHPIGNTKFIDYSVGPAVAIGNLERIEYEDFGSIYKHDRFDFSAVLLEGNMTLHSNSHFVFAFHASGGTVIGNTVVNKIVGQVGMKIGLRF